jgi:hypothetical protein
MIPASNRGVKLYSNIEYFQFKKWLFLQIWCKISEFSQKNNTIFKSLYNYERKMSASLLY